MICPSCHGHIQTETYEERLAASGSMEALKHNEKMLRDRCDLLKSRLERLSDEVLNGTPHVAAMIAEECETLCKEMTL